MSSEYLSPKDLNKVVPLDKHLEKFYPDLYSELWLATPTKLVGNACPFGNHQTKNKKRLNIDIPSGVFNCFGCPNVGGYGAAAWEMEENGGTYAENMRKVMQMHKIDAKAKDISPEDEKRLERIAGEHACMNSAAEFWHKNLHSERQYFTDQTFDDNFVNDNFFGYASPDDDRLAKHLQKFYTQDQILATRLCYSDGIAANGMHILKDCFNSGHIYPYRNESRQITYFSMRDDTGTFKGKYKKLGTDEKGDKFGNIPISPANNHCVLGGYKVLGKCNNPVLIVEGVKDYYLATQHLSDDCVTVSPGACFFSEKQMQVFSKLLANRIVADGKCPDIVICFDADKSGRDGAMKTAKDLKRHVMKHLNDVLGPPKKESDSKKENKSNAAAIAVKQKPKMNDAWIPNIRIARLQMLPNSKVSDIVDEEGNDIKGSIDLADYITQGRIDELKVIIHPEYAPTVSMTELYDKGSWKYCFDGKTFKPGIYCHFYISEGRYFQNKNDEPRRYNGRIYAADDGEIGTDADPLLKGEFDASRVKQIEKTLASKHNKRKGRIENPERYIPFLNGWIDIEAIDFNNINPEESFNLVKPTPFEFLTREVQANFKLELDEEKKPIWNTPKFDKFLNDICPGCEKLIYQMIGYCFHNSCEMEKIFFLYGPPGTGKSTLIKIIQGLLGKGNYMNQSLHYLEENRFALATLEGCFANLCADISDEPITSIDKIKKVASGDDLILELKGVDSVTNVLGCKQIHSMNDFPPIFSSTAGFIDRLAIAIFPNKFRDTDNEERRNAFVADILTEADGIATKALLRYFSAYAKQKFYVPDVALDFLADYVEDLDRCFDFVYNYVEIKKDGFVSRDQLKSAYNTYCQDKKKYIQKEGVLYSSMRSQFKKIVAERFGAELDGRATVENDRGKRLQTRGFHHVQLFPVTLSDAVGGL